MRPPELRCEIPHERGLSRDLRRVGQKERNRVGARREPRRRRQAAPASVVVMLREAVREKKRMNPERREGWDSMIQFVAKYVGNDVYGNNGPEHGWYPKTFPDPGQKI